MIVADDAISISPNVEITLNALYLLQITKVDAIGISSLFGSFELTMASSTVQVTVYGSCSCLKSDGIPIPVVSYTLAVRSGITIYADWRNLTKLTRSLLK